MELGSSSNLHFIQTIIDGRVTKVLNVFRGKPRLKLKSICDIHESTVDKNRRGLKRERVDFHNESVRGSSGSAEESDFDDFNFMTLKEMWEKCRAKRRRLTSFACSSGETSQTYLDWEGEIETALCSSASHGSLVNYMGIISSQGCEITSSCNQETRFSLITYQEDEIARAFDVNTWMLALLNEEPLCCILSEDCYIERGDSVSNYADCLDIVQVAEESTFTFSKTGPIIQFLTDEDPKMANSVDLDVKIIKRSVEGPEMAKSAILDTGILNLYSNNHDTANASGSETISNNKELQLCVTGEQSNDHLDCVDHESLVDVLASSHRKLLDPSKVIRHYLEFQMCLYPKDSTEPSSPRKVNVYDTNNSDHILRSHEKLSNISTVHLDEHDNNPGLFLLLDGPKDGSTQHNASVKSSYVHDNGSSTPISEDSSAVGKHSPSLFHVDEIGSLCNKISTAVDKPATPIKAKDFHFSSWKRPPERLFSGRKTISPTSQRRLHKAMKSAELDAEQYFKHAKELCYAKETENKTGHEGHNQIKRTKFLGSPQQVVRKTNGDENSLSREGILRNSHRSLVLPPSRNSIQSLQESVIAFTQQQMCGFETIATKLTGELNSMKDIVAGTPTIRAADKIKIAIDNAMRVQKSARRWLSKMARDCDRFCKIMKSTGEGPAAPSTKVNRRVTFADEVGGKLCDVKIYVNEMATSTSGKIIV